MGFFSDLLGGGDAGKSEMEQANKLMRDNVARLEAIGVPTVEAQKIALENPQLVGLLQAEFLGPSAYQDVQEDPRLKQAQLSALQDMTQIAQTGLAPEDRAAFNEIRRQLAGQRQAESATALQQMQERGTMDSGAAVLAQLQAGQRAEDLANQQSNQLLANAGAARRAALGQQSDMAARMSQQQLGLAGQKASAADVINQFNTQNRQNVNAQNLATKQSLEQQRAANANQQQLYNKGLIQQEFQNKMAKATGVTGAQSNLAQQYANQAAAAQQGQQAETGALLNLAGTIGAAALKKG